MDDFQVCCRICQCPDSDELVTPCKCRGTIRFVHQQCLLKWCRTQERPWKCELCQNKFRTKQVYKNFLAGALLIFVELSSFLLCASFSLAISVNLVLLLLKQPLAYLITADGIEKNFAFLTWFVLICFFYWVLNDLFSSALKLSAEVDVKSTMIKFFSSVMSILMSFSLINFVNFAQVSVSEVEVKRQNVFSCMSEDKKCVALNHVKFALMAVALSFVVLLCRDFVKLVFELRRSFSSRVKNEFYSREWKVVKFLSYKD